MVVDKPRTGVADAILYEGTQQVTQSTELNLNPNPNPAQEAARAAAKPTTVHTPACEPPFPTA